MRAVIGQAGASDADRAEVGYALGRALDEVQSYDAAFEAYAGANAASRKATGARNRDILVQFLTESVTITSAGAAIGVVLGLGIAFLAAAIMRMQTEAPVHAAVSVSTILVAAVASVVVGITFGLYPALRASRLSPIDAIRHE